jgi:hypothetical protein
MTYPVGSRRIKTAIPLGPLRNKKWAWLSKNAYA